MRTVLVICLAAVAALVSAQMPIRQTSADIHEAMKKLNVLASVLYVAAHPDDENTNLISYLSNGRHYETRYISLTRGDGGQNLIGTELREQLGVIRTEELLAARRIDGGYQSFSRANDFGYSKNPEETLRIWDSTAVLADLVWAIRLYQPDVLVNRFWHGTERPNHGHHTASAQLAIKAFDLAADPTAFPEQLKNGVTTWQPKRQLCNMSWWFYGSQEAFEKVDKADFVSMDIGTYYPAKGKSNREIAAESRSQHRCQAMGTIGERGEYIEWFKHIKGNQAVGDLFSGVDTTWGRIPGAAPIQRILDGAIADYRFDNPAASVPSLLAAYKLMLELPDGYWKRTKLEETRALIQACMGLYLEATAGTYAAAAGDSIEISIEATLRSNTSVTLTNNSFGPVIRDTTLNLLLVNNKANKFKTRIKLPDNLPTTEHYWLNGPTNTGTYQVDNQQLRGLPRTPRMLKAEFVLEFAGEQYIGFPIEIAYKWEEPSRGEVWRPFEVTPPVFVNLPAHAFVFPKNQSRDITVQVRSGRANVEADIRLEVPSGWTVSPAVQHVAIAKYDMTQNVTFNVKGPSNVFVTDIFGSMRATATVGTKTYDREVTYIKYDHIPTQTLMRPNESRIVNSVFQRGTAQNIGYIVGAGDDIPAALTQVGYHVSILTEKDVTAENLAQFDAVVLGIRAYNTQEWLRNAQPTLHQYAENGGTLIVQYNTNFDLYVESLSPIKMKLGRDRVTDENAEMRFLLPEHPVLNTPNKLTTKDFEGWTQERGIYFPAEWDAAFAAPLSCNDPSEAPKNGSLIVAPYGKGHFVYTGLVFFRELPAGVPGAYRLFANLLAL